MASTRNYVAVHKELTRDHQVITTIGEFDGDESLDHVVAWCKKANANGFNYKPYPKTVYLPHRRPE